MNYIQYMKPGSKFWSLPNGLEDVAWSEFWNNWKKAVVKAKEQIVDNWENLKQDYKDAADPIAASERKQAESIEATRAKQASMKFVSDNRTDHEKKRDRRDFELKEFEQKRQLNKEATDAVMWTLTGPVYAVQHLASPNGVVKTYGNTKAAVQNGGGPYIEKAVASAAGDVLDATILAAPLLTPEARLARELNRNIKQGIQSGLYYHGSPNRNISMFKTGKDGGIYFTQSRDAAKLYTGTFGTGKVYNVDLNLGNKTITIDNGGAAWTKIPENTVAKAFNLTPLQVHDIIGSYNLGEVPWHYGFTNMFGYKPKNNYYAIDQVVKLGKDLGISSLIINNVKDNGKRLFSRTMPYDLTVVYNPRQIIFGGQTSNLKHHAPLPQTGKTTSTKTSLAFFERLPAKISEAERLGIPKGDRGNLSRFQKEALEDLTTYRNKWIRQKYPLLDSNGNIIWSNGTNKSFLDTYVAPLRGDQYKGVLLYPHIEDDGSYLMRMSMGSDDLNGGFAGYNGISEITLTSPKMNAINLEIPIPIEQASPTLPKEGVKTFWAALQDVALPGSYISGDFGGRPLGYNLIHQYNKIGTPIVSTTNTGVRTIIGRNGYLNVLNELFRKIPWKSHYDGLSTDSYMALLKLGNRPGYKLRFSKDGFTNWNHLSFENKYILDLYEQALIDPTKLQEFLKVFHDWVAPYGGHDAVMKNGKIIIPLPFIVRQKSGGTIKIKKKNVGSFTRYCNGKVTEECIRKGKNSSNPTTRKRANFAWVARHKFKHEEGGKINYLNYFNYGK